MITRTYEELADTITSSKLNYKFFDKGAYNLNVIAERKDDVFDNAPSDVLHVAYRDEKLKPKVLTIKWTTMPGTVGAVYTPITTGGINVKTGKWEVVTGVAALVEAQYLKTYKYVKNVDYWLKYSFLQQVKPVMVYRDSNRDNILNRTAVIHTDEGLGQANLFKIHQHIMSPKGVDSNVLNYIYNNKPVVYTMGCQGSPEPSFKKYIELVDKSAKLYGDILTYTLVGSSDFK